MWRLQTTFGVTEAEGSWQYRDKRRICSWLSQLHTCKLQVRLRCESEGNVWNLGEKSQKLGTRDWNVYKRELWKPRLASSNFYFPPNQPYGGALIWRIISKSISIGSNLEQLWTINIWYQVKPRCEKVTSGQKIESWQSETKPLILHVRFM